MIKFCLHRFFKILTFRKGLYGKIGKHNKIKKNVFIEEYATVGNNNYISTRVMISNACIGNYCSIAPDVKIGLAQHDTTFVTTYNGISKLFSKSMVKDKTIIGNDVWIGANAILMQGIKVGNGAVIGAGAIVTKDVDDFTVVVGNPAHYLKKRFSDNIISDINKSEWWLKEKKEAIKLIESMERKKTI